MEIKIPIYVIGLALSVLGALIGIKIADIDQNLPFMKHRSMWTHGIIVPLVLFWGMTDLGYAILDKIFEDDMLRQIMKKGFWFYFEIGFCPAYAVHLASDMFPAQWRGNAKIHTPLGRMPALLSQLWLGAGMLASFYVMLNVLDTNWKWLLGIGGIVTIGALSYNARNKNVFWKPLLMVLFVLIVALGGKLIA